MSNERPQYGEYASPDEQRARAGLPPVPDASEVAQSHAGSSPAQPAVKGPGAGFMDRVAAFALLGIGLVNVLTSLGGFFDLAGTLDQTRELMGITGEFTNFAGARTWGAAAAVVLLAGYALTVWFTVRRVRARRSAWWLPLVGWVVTMIVVSVCISVPMLADPVFMEGLSSAAR